MRHISASPGRPATSRRIQAASGGVGTGECGREHAEASPATIKAIDANHLLPRHRPTPQLWLFGGTELAAALCVWAGPLALSLKCHRTVLNCSPIRLMITLPDAFTFGASPLPPSGFRRR